MERSMLLKPGQADYCGVTPRETLSTPRQQLPRESFTSAPLTIHFMRSMPAQANNDGALLQREVSALHLPSLMGLDTLAQGIIRCTRLMLLREKSCGASRREISFSLRLP